MTDTSTRPGSLFPFVAYGEWRHRVDVELGASIAARALEYHTPEGLVFHALYTADEPHVGDSAARVTGVPSWRQGDGAGARIRLPLSPSASAEGFRAQWEADLSSGATSVRLPPGVQPDVMDEGFDAFPAGAELVLGQAVRPGAPVLEWARRWWDSSGEGAGARLALAVDPLGAWAAETSDSAGSQPALELARAVEWAQWAQARGGAIRIFQSGSHAVHLAGAGHGQELGLVLAGAIDLLRACERVGMAPEKTLATLDVAVQLDPEFLLEIAKLRAGRRLLARIAEVCGVPGADAQVRWVAETSARSLTRWDPWGNVLRNAAAAFAAHVGGADVFVSLPHDGVGTSPAALGRRIARNAPLILDGEAHLGEPVDPAAGSWALEGATAAIEEAAWQVVQAIEEQGGLALALSTGWVAALVGRTAAVRAKELATRKRGIIGVSEFPLGSEQPPAPAREEPLAGGASPLPRLRWAAPFEDLRDAAWQSAQGALSRPRAHLVTLGSLAEYTARAAFARNLLEVGGFEVSEGGAADSAAEHAERFRASGASIAVVCGPDVHYVDLAAPVAAALRAAGASLVALAGRPGEREASDRAAGVEDYIFVGVDALDTLARWLSRAGVER